MFHYAFHPYPLPIGCCLVAGRCLGVTIEGPPIPFSPFSVTDCTMLDYFSFNDFVAVAFPDLAEDLDIQI